MEAAKQRLPNAKSERDKAVANQQALAHRIAQLEKSLTANKEKVGEARHRQNTASTHNRQGDLIMNFKRENNYDGILGRLVGFAQGYCTHGDTVGRSGHGRSQVRRGDQQYGRHAQSLGGDRATSRSQGHQACARQQRRSSVFHRTGQDTAAEWMADTGEFIVSLLID